MATDGLSHRSPDLLRLAGALILVDVLTWLLALAVTVTAIAGLIVSGCLAVRRYSGSHLVAHLAVSGRGLYLSRTADGLWWRLRLRPRRRVCEDRNGWDEPPPDSGVREPRRPLGPGPGADAVRLQPPL